MTVEWRGGMDMHDEEIEEVYKNDIDPEPVMEGALSSAIMLGVCMAGASVALMLWLLGKVAVYLWHFFQN